MKTSRLYLDHAATTPILPEARTAVAEGMARWANPSSPHAEGRAARAALEEARTRIKAALGWDHHLIFTSGASEAIALALTRTQADAVFVSATEHDAVHRVRGDAYFIDVGKDGRMHADALIGRLAALGAKMPLVAVQAANNETGVLQPLDDLVPVVRKAGGLFFADCAQSAGKLPLPDADLIAVSAHKLGGPPGIGALLVRDLGVLGAVGGQEQGYRPGTENLPGALGFAAACEDNRSWMARAGDLRAHLDSAIVAAGGKVVARTAPRIATIASSLMPGVASTTQLIQFDMAGIAVSAGSACSSGTIKPSHVLKAMGWSDAEAGQVVRVSFGPETSRADVYRFIDVWKRIKG
ncbi:MAG: aminotransferase class V-fold PLP-dependent enzyme [Alphaproteobacteria bacterium]|nr:aminotransferase class V-fold PLP-dependent enzyme [Alphaproteobacteria bacterium]